MRFSKMAAAAAILGLAIVPVHAQKNGAKAHAPAKASSPKASVTKITKFTGAPKTQKTPTTKIAKATKAPKVAKDTGPSSTSTASTASTTSSGTSTATPIPPSAVDFTEAPVGQKLAKNGALRAKLESRLTTLGYDGTVYQAAYGFKNQGQFVAATNVSRNLGISFEQLKLQMTGLSVTDSGTILKANLGPNGTVTMVDPSLATNPAPTRSLGQAIQTVKSDVNATAAAQTATTQANTEIATTSTTAAR